MTGAGAVDGKRYRAFISYSHKDAAFARRLHQRLERYVLPKRLGAGRRLAPIFKDRDELPAAHDLSAQVNAALEHSDCLIVVCSPDAATSIWVKREIETFLALRPGRPILTALHRGEPATAFPTALRTAGVEPLAADFRKEGDGQHLALLKLIAGVAGVGVDQLIQRDAQRRLRVVMTVTVASMAGMLAMGGITAIAFDARAEADRHRREAEGLIDFMLTTLREELKGAGSLRVRSAVNNEALSYYGRQAPGRLSPSSARQEALLMLAMAEDDTARGDMDSARSWVSRADEILRPQSEKWPDDPDVVWAQAQSTFWQGYLAFAARDATATRLHWTRYRDHADRLAQLEPGSPRTLLELANVEMNLCTLAVRLEKAVVHADQACPRAVARMARAAAAQPRNDSVTFDHANGYGWLADSHALAGRPDDARAARFRQIALLDRLLEKEPENAKWLENWAAAHQGLAKIAVQSGDYSSARRHLHIVQSAFEPLSRRDPDNNQWRAHVTQASDAIVWLNKQ